MTGADPNKPPQSEGARRLELIGRADLIGQAVTLADGVKVDAETFSCGRGADEVFAGIDATPEGDERNEAIEAARIIFETHFGSIIQKPEET